VGNKFREKHFTSGERKKISVLKTGFYRLDWAKTRPKVMMTIPE